MGVRAKIIKHKKIRNLFSNDEKAALQAVLDDTGAKPKSLKARHTKTLFVWEQKVRQ